MRKQKKHLLRCIRGRCLGWTFKRYTKGGETARTAVSSSMRLLRLSFLGFTSDAKQTQNKRDSVLLLHAVNMASSRAASSHPNETFFTLILYHTQTSNTTTIISGITSPFEKGTEPSESLAQFCSLKWLRPITALCFSFLSF